MNVVAILLVSLIVGTMLKRSIKFLQASLIPTSVISGTILIIIAGIYKWVTVDVMFDTLFFDGKGTVYLEVITYHALALGFIASTLKSSGGKLTKKRTSEIFNTGVTTVSTYLLQGILGLCVSIIAALVIKDFFKAAGMLLPFGYGQGTGQALNYGTIYETENGFVGGKVFGLTIAATGFVSAAIGGVIHLNINKSIRSRRKTGTSESVIRSEEIQSANEIPMQESLDKLTVQIAFIAGAYLAAYLLMFVLGKLLPGMRAVIYGFNFLLGVLSATIVKAVLNLLKKKNLIHREYTNDFLMTRTSNFFFDLMVVAGVAAIRLDTLEQYWGILLIMGVVGAVATYFYNRIVAKSLFPEYVEEQFLMMYGMLTGTASTGTILLREIDDDFNTPAADNMVYQNFPAIAFGFPLMLLATLAPKMPEITLLILVGFFIVMNVILFRSKIFKKKNKK